MTMSLAMALAGAVRSRSPLRSRCSRSLSPRSPWSTSPCTEPSMFDAAIEAAPESVARGRSPARGHRGGARYGRRVRRHRIQLRVPSYEMSDLEISTDEGPAYEPRLRAGLRAVGLPGAELPQPRLRVAAVRLPLSPGPGRTTPRCGDRRSPPSGASRRPRTFRCGASPLLRHRLLRRRPADLGRRPLRGPHGDARGAGHAEPETVEDIAVDEVPVEEAAAEVAAQEAAIQDAVTEEFTTPGEDDVRDAAAPEPEVAELAPVFARTASDPAPRSLDVTSFLPPLSLLPPLPGSRSGRGARRCRRRRAAPRSARPVPRVPALPRPPRPDPDAGEHRAGRAPGAPSETPSETLSQAMAVEADDNAPVDTGAPAGRPRTGSMRDWRSARRSPRVPRSPPSRACPCRRRRTSTCRRSICSRSSTPRHAGRARDPVGRRRSRARPPRLPHPPGRSPGSGADTAAALSALGLPEAILGDGFADDVADVGTYAALTRALGLGSRRRPRTPTGAGEVLFVVGPGVETLRAARSLAAGLRLDPEPVQWATRGDLAGLAPRSSRVTTVEAAIAVGTERRRRRHGDDRRRRRPDAHRRLLDGADAGHLVAGRGVGGRRGHPQARGPRPVARRPAAASTRSSSRTPTSAADPAAVLRRVATPVAVIDGVRATPHRWASLLCERLETRRA